MGEQQEAYNTYEELIAALRSLCRESNSGTMYIATPDNQFARIVLKDGAITSLSFRTKHGAEALPLIRSIPAGRFKFSPGQVAVDAESSLPPDYDAIAFLCADLAPVETAAKNGLSRAALAQAPKLIETALADFLGPIAPMVCEEHLLKHGVPQTSQALRDFVDALAREIGDPAKARRFRAAVLGALGN